MVIFSKSEPGNLKISEILNEPKEIVYSDGIKHSHSNDI